jgi:hypothetical protein
LLEGLNLAKIQKFNKKWASVFYEANIPFNVMQHMVLIKAMKATFEFQTYYKPLSCHGLCTNLLEQSKVDVSKQIIQRTRNLIHKYGVAFCFDGWDNIAWHPLLNIMFVCASGYVFVGSIDATKEWKDAHYICNTLGGYIKTIGINNIVQMCINNASN